MSILKCIFNNKEQIIPIACSTRIGRHWSNDICLNDPKIPMYWVEIRWIGTAWRWKIFSAEERTRGMGAVINSVWREWSKGASIRLDGFETEGALRISSLSDAPPMMLIEDQTTKKRYYGEDMLRYVEVWQTNRVIPIDDVTREKPLQDGDIFCVRNKIFRFLHTEQDFITKPLKMKVVDPNTMVEINIEEKVAYFSNQNHQAVVRGASVLTLATYARAVKQRNPWLETTMAFDMWRELRGKDSSTPERLGWDRGKVRNQLSKQSCFGLKELFLTRQNNGFYETMLNLQSEQIEFVL